MILLQEWIAFLIVGAVAARMIWKIFRALLGERIAVWLLNRGNIKMAMWIRPSVGAAECGGCNCRTGPVKVGK